VGRWRVVAGGACVGALAAAIGCGGAGGREDEPARLSIDELRAAQLASRESVVRYMLYDALRPVKLANCELERFGERHDGGYLMCGNLLGSVRAGYSYGISNYDQWGCDVATRLDVPVHQYDCFDTRQPACPTGKTVFHPECIGPEPSTEEGRSFNTLATQFRRNGDEGRRLVVKMDVEGAEWESLLLAPDEVLEQIDQLVVEMHGVSEPKYAAAVQRLNGFFHVANVHFNNFSCESGIEPFPAWAYEVLFVNKRIGIPDTSGGAPSPPAGDAPNNPGLADCQGWRPQEVP
jgi:hypothetical protein